MCTAYLVKILVTTYLAFWALAKFLVLNATTIGETEVMPGVGKY